MLIFLITILTQSHSIYEDLELNMYVNTVYNAIVVW